MGGRPITNETNIEKLRDMRLTALSDAFRTQKMDTSTSALSFEERLGLLVDIEWASRKLNKAEIQRLATCSYITDKHNIIIMGATGTGKSYMACAFGIAACQRFKTVKYIRMPDLLVELAIARNEGS